MGLENVDLEAFTYIVTAQGDAPIYTDDDGRPLNPRSNEAYLPCGLMGSDMVDRVLPATYYNAKIGKPILFVGPSGTGKTALSECLIRNFHNGSVYDDDGNLKENEGDNGIIEMKRKSPERIQNYANILPEAVIGEWNAWKLLRAESSTPDTELWTKDYFRLGTLSKALDAGKGLVLDEITRAGEETQNVYLEPLREGKVSIETLCFGKCEKEIGEEPGKKSKKAPVESGFQVYATANEGDIGTQDLSTALQTRFSRIPMDFIAEDDERNLILNRVFKGSVDDDQKFIAEKAACLTSYFRKNVPLDAMPSTKDANDLAYILSSIVAIDNRSKKEVRFNKVGLSSPVIQARAGEAIKSVFGKNRKDANSVYEVLASGKKTNVKPGAAKPGAAKPGAAKPGAAEESKAAAPCGLVLKPSKERK